MKRMLVAACAVLAVAGEARAESLKRKVHLTWTPMKTENPRTRGRSALVPSAQVVWLDLANGLRFMGVTYDDGTYCSSTAGATEILMFTCGSHRGHYNAVSVPGEYPEMMWMTEDPSVEVGSK